METLVIQFEKQKHFLSLSPPSDFFFFLQEIKSDKVKYKQLTVWNLTLISISLCFFSVSFSISYCKKLSFVIHFKQNQIWKRKFVFQFWKREFMRSSLLSMP